MSLQAGLQKSGEYHQKNVADGGGGLTAEIRAAKTSRIALETAARDVSIQNVDRLCELYIASLKNKKTAGEVRSTLKHVPASLRKRVACTVSVDDWTDLLRVVATKTSRTANKIRTCMMAAYNLALYARSDMAIDIAFKHFGVTNNPFACTRPNAEGAGNADRNPLSKIEMQRYFEIIRDIEGFTGALLRIHLLTGGLRVLQLLRLKKSDVDFEFNTFTLYDEKGRRKHAAKYTTPILPMLVKDFKFLIEQSATDLVFCLPDKTTPVWQSSALGWAKKTVGDQIEGFTLKRIRSGVETILSSRRVDKEIRGRLLSHGVSSVQDRHYDGHEYIKEKLEALNILLQVLTATPATLIKMAGVA